MSVRPNSSLHFETDPSKRSDSGTKLLVSRLLVSRDLNACLSHNVSRDLGNGVPGVEQKDSLQSDNDGEPSSVCIDCQAKSDLCQRACTYPLLFLYIVASAVVVRAILPYLMFRKPTSLHDHICPCCASFRLCCQGDTVEAMTNTLATYDYVCNRNRKTRVSCLPALPWSPERSLRHPSAPQGLRPTMTRVGLARHSTYKFRRACAFLPSFFNFFSAFPFQV